MTSIRNPHLSKEQIKILLLEGISDQAVQAFKDAGYSAITRLTKALDREGLAEALKDVRILGIRSRTQITAEVLDATERTAAIGCFSVGTNQVDLDAACRRGVPVFNAPFSNTRSVAELTIAEIVMLYRSIFPKSVSAHGGGWDKSAVGSREVRGKTLGIVGYGNIGSQLAVLAEAMGLRVIYYDHVDKLVYGNVQPMATLDDLLSAADIVTLHVPETPATHMMIGAREIALMKQGSFLINNARGTVVDLDALAAALREKRLAGAAIDVFPIEPTSNSERFASPLQGLDNVILTPHIGGSTEEAQERIGQEVAKKLIEYSDVGSTLGAVNFPQVQLPPRPVGTRFLQIHRNVPGEMRRLNEVFARHKVNIAAQYLQTNADIGYVVLDADGAVPDAPQIIQELREMDGTIRARVLWQRG
jgi:D-3-phosphoglycerate dehydrogenase / 2-oxoglutarate reductase